MTLTELLTRLKELALQAEKRNIITNSRDALFFRNMATPENILKLIEVIEIQNEALERQSAPHIEQFCIERAREVLSRCQKIGEEK